MVINILLIIALIALFSYATRRYVKNLDDVDDELAEELEVDIDLKYLITETKHFFSNLQKQNFEDANLTRDELARKNKRKADLSKALHRSKYGDKDAKRLVKGYIKDLLLKESYDIFSCMNSIINFNEPEKATGNDLFEIILYLYEREYEEQALDTFFKDFEIAKHTDKDSNGLDVYKVSTDKLRTVWRTFEGTATDEEIRDILKMNPDKEINVSISSIELDNNDKLEILAQRIFERYLGLSVVDKIFEQAIDEIDCGVSGIPAGSFMKKVQNQDATINYSYDSIWVLYHGVNIRLECLGFGSQNELVRVCNNIYKYDAPYVMSKNQSRVLATMIDGSRILVVRPPMASSYGFFLRKFDTASGTTLDALITKDKNKWLPIALIKWFVTGQQNLAVTGQQGTGKTTTLAAIIRYIDPLFNIRIQEMQHELNMRYTYPERNAVELQETEVISAQEILNLTKKMNGAVTIIGEVASAIQASHIIQTAMVGSLFTLFTHHAKTTSDWVNAIADNLLQIGLYKDKKDAVRATAGVLRIDVHMAMVKGNRHIERITEVIPVEDVPYPSSIYQIENVQKKYINEHITEVEDENHEMKKVLIDTPEFFKRMTDPELFTTRQLMHWESDDADGVSGHFVLDNLPSENLINEMLGRMTRIESDNFKRDMKMIEYLANGVDVEGKKEWIKKVYSY